MAFIEVVGNLVIQPFDTYYFKRFAGILKGKGDVLKALLKEKEFEKAHDEKRYLQLFKAKKISR